MVADVLDDISRLLEEAHGPGRVAGVVKCDPVGVVPARIELQLSVPDQIGGEFGDMDHLRRPGVFEPRPGDGETGSSRKSAGPFIVSMYWWITRHMWPHSPPRIHLTPRRLASA